VGLNAGPLGFEDGIVGGDKITMLVAPLVQIEQGQEPG
jgi:hypothetical protein